MAKTETDRSFPADIRGEIVFHEGSIMLERDGYGYPLFIIEEAKAFRRWLRKVEKEELFRPEPRVKK